MKRSLLSKRCLMVAVATLALFCGISWQRGLQPSSGPVKAVSAAAQAVQYQVTNHYAKLGTDTPPVELVEVTLPNQKVTAETPFVGDISTLENATLTVKNVSGQPVKQIGLRLTMYGLDGQMADVVRGHGLGEMTGASTKTFSLLSTARLLQSHSARLARSFERIEIKVEYVEFHNEELWHHGLMHTLTNGFKRARTWVAKGREQKSAQMFEEYQRLTGQEVDTPPVVQQFFQERSARQNARPQLLLESNDCWTYLGYTTFDCGANELTGCEAGTDYGSYTWPFGTLYFPYYTMCFATIWPPPVDCSTFYVSSSFGIDWPCN